MDKVQEIMELVSKLTKAQITYESVLDIPLSAIDGDSLDRASHDVKRTHDALESKLRALLERKPLDAHQRMEVLHAIPDDDDDEEEWMLTDKQIQLIIDGVERAHGIGA